MDGIRLLAAASFVALSALAGEARAADGAVVTRQPSEAAAAPRSSKLPVVAKAAIRSRR